MFKLIKYLKPFILSIILVIGLLFLQAACDLSLPEYMSNIVNIGIQQGGIKNAVPDVIRKSEMEKLTFFMSEGDKEEVLKNYTLLDKNSLSQNDLDKYVKDYPSLKEEVLYKLNTDDSNTNSTTIDKLNTIIGKPAVIVSMIEKNGLSGLSQDGQKPAQTLPANVDPFVALSKMPKEQTAAMQKQIDEKFASMPASMVTQAAVVFIKGEYQKIGINTDKLQSNFILYSGFLMILIALISMIATVIVGYIGAKVAAGLGRNLRGDVFGKVTSFSSIELDKFSTASLITRSTNDIQQVQMFMIMMLRIVFYAPILGIGGVLKVLKTETSMGWIIAVAVMAILTLVIVLFSLAMPKFKSIQKLVDRINMVTREALTGMLVIRAFGTQKYEEQKFDKANRDITKTNLFVNRMMTIMMPAMMLIMNFITILIIWVGAHQVDEGAIQVGDMMAFMQYTMQIIMSFLMISMVSIILPRASVSAQRIGEVLGTKLNIKNPERQEAFKNIQKGYVEYRNVSFRYPEADEDVISDISFVAKPGETTAFIGSTGSGKSTVINLLPRFYDVTGGQILLDGVDIRNVSQHELREKIGYVPQKGMLFSGTIESNLKYGKENASQEDLENAAEIAQATEFISGKPEGYATEISQGGTNVSGGQKQRLSIARALVKKPEVFIFDDSFSALDFKTDSALRSALKAKTKDSTLLLVAQRISTIMTAEQIIVLDEGKIVGKGTHKELMETCEVYKQIALSQLSKEELNA